MGNTVEHFRPRRTRTVMLGLVSAIAAVALVITSEVAGGPATRVALDGVATALAGLAAGASRSIWLIVVDTFRRPTVHTRIERRGDDFTVRVIDDREHVVGRAH